MSDTTNSGAPKARTGPAQFLREVRTELRRVAWPSRGEVVQYSLIVLVTTLIIGAFIFGLDQLFGQLVFWIFG
ncbi:preprotein translocase subunit SecE [Euzebya sp.]|uniref:preprotein translocase subunit SecE n=1 Tax=Euzebya sp. TaxID=1971409 RepID=UPI0035128860